MTGRRAAAARKPPPEGAGTRAWRRLGALLLACVLAACATKQGEVVLLPEAGGAKTAVVIEQGGRTVVLDQPYAAANLTSRGPDPYQADAAKVQAAFGPALAARPQPPQQFTLFFVEGRDEFTEASRRDFDGVLTEIARRPVPDVLVIGHTDTVGSDALNDPLSRQRAEVVRRALIARGVPAQDIAVVGRGKREPAVATGDNVAEPRNRRVEILVR
jgi:outer membrane protein OmpA-like peptidoglycan-associated protein